MAHETFRRQSWLLVTLLKGCYTYKELAQMWLEAPENEDHSRLIRRTFCNDIDEIESVYSVAVSCNRNTGYRYGIRDTDFFRRNVAGLVRSLSKRSIYDDDPLDFAS